MTSSNETSTPKREQLAFNWGPGEKAKFDASLEEFCARTGQRVPAREFILALIERAGNDDSAEQLAARLRELGVDQLLDAFDKRRAADERLVVAIADSIEALQTEKRQIETDLLNTNVELLTLKTSLAAAASKDEQLHQWEQQVRELNWKIGELEPALSEERARRAELEQAALSAGNERDEARAELTRMIGVLDETTKRINELEASRGELADTLEKERVSHAETAKMAASVVSERDTATLEAARLKNELEAASARIKELDADRSRERDTARRMMEKASALERELNSQNAARASITAERDTAKAEIERLAAEVAELRKEADEKHADMVEVRKELITAWNEKAAAEAKAQAQTETIAALREALATVRTFNAPEAASETRKEEKQGKGKVKGESA